MDELNIDLEGLQDAFNKNRNKVPTILFGRKYDAAYLNKAFWDIIDTEFMRVSYNGNYIVMKPANVGSSGAFKVTYAKGGSHRFCCRTLLGRFPDLRGKYFKVYKVAGGDAYCIKRDEGKEIGTT